MAEPVWIWWSRGEPEDDLHGFLTREDRDAEARGEPGPFRRIVRDHHRLGPVPLEKRVLDQLFQNGKESREAMRACFKCGRKLEACNGFCKAGDVLDLIKGRRTERPRELCGLCVELWRWTKNGKLRRKKPEPWLVKSSTQGRKRNDDREPRRHRRTQDVRYWRS